MSANPKPKKIRSHAWRQAIENLDAALAKNAPQDNREAIELFGAAHFGKFWKPRRDSDSQEEPN
jgi:hypothetical protein